MSNSLSGAPRPFPETWSAEKLGRDSTIWSHPNIYPRGQGWQVGEPCNAHVAIFVCTFSSLTTN